MMKNEILVLELRQLKKRHLLLEDHIATLKREVAATKESADSRIATVLDLVKRMLRVELLPEIDQARIQLGLGNHKEANARVCNSIQIILNELETLGEK